MVLLTKVNLAHKNLFCLLHNISYAGAKYAISSSFIIFILKATTWKALRTTALIQTFHMVLETA